MPLYTFECNNPKCGLKDEYLLPVGGTPEECYRCKGHDLKRVLEGQTFEKLESGDPSIRFKCRSDATLLGVISCGICNEPLGIFKVRISDD